MDSPIGELATSMGDATPTPWELDQMGNIWKRGDTKVAHLSDHPLQAQLYREQSAEERLANASLIVTAVNNHAALVTALNYVADMTCIGTDCEWHFKSGYDPQVVLDALSAASASETGKEG